MIYRFFSIFATYALFTIASCDVSYAFDAQSPDHSCDAYHFDPLPPKDNNGWTAFALAERTIYVSAQNQNKVNTASTFYVTTLDQGNVLLRAGHADQLLFNRGETFDGRNGLNFNYLGGKDSQHPTVIGAYGVGTRPVLTFSKTNGLLNLLGSQSNLAIVHLDLQGTSLSDVDGLRIVNANKNILIEDVRIQGFTNDLNFDTKVGAQNFVVRRSQLLDSHSRSGGNNFGIYASRVAGLFLDELVMDHNGNPHTVFNRNAYIQVDTKCVSFTRSYSIHSNAEAIELRSGGVFENNFLGWDSGTNYGFVLGGDVSAGLVPKGVSGDIENNVFYAYKDITPLLPRTGGLYLANLQNVKVDGNLFLRTDGFVLASKSGLGIHGLTLTNNVVFGSPTFKFLTQGQAFGPLTLLPDGSGRSYVMNAKGEVVISNMSTGIAMAPSAPKFFIPDTGSLVSGNVFQSGLNDFLNLNGISVASMKMVSQTAPVLFKNPNISVLGFQGVTSEQALTDHLRQNSYEPLWSAPALNAYLKAGLQQP